MSEPAPDPLELIEANNPAPAPSPRLPDDIIHVIMEHYVGARLQELEAIASDRLTWFGHDRTPEWRVIPVLLSSKHLRDLLLSKLYRYTLLLNKRIFQRFLELPAIASYRLVQVLDIVDAAELKIEDAESRAMHFLVKHSLDVKAGSEHRSYSQFLDIRSTWFEECRPVIEELRLRDGAIQSPLGLVTL
jgi:hypothetical protein